jgi:hypothetical protein
MKTHVSDVICSCSFGKIIVSTQNLSVKMLTPLWYISLTDLYMKQLLSNELFEYYAAKHHPMIHAL